MPPPRQKTLHTVAPGDHLSRVAAVNGFRSYVPLAEEPANKPLLQQRRTPHVLAVGDPIDVPPIEVREVERATDQRHRFRAHIPELVVRVKHLAWAGNAEKTPGAVTGDGKSLAVQPGSGGVFTVPVEPLTDRITASDAGSVGSGELFMRVGFLQPLETAAGVRQRLTNLGYEAGDQDDFGHLPFRSAIEEFQCDQGMVVDGKVGPDTRARLRKVHGC